MSINFRKEATSGTNITKYRPMAKISYEVVFGCNPRDKNRFVQMCEDPDTPTTEYKWSSKANSRRKTTAKP